MKTLLRIPIAFFFAAVTIGCNEKPTAGKTQGKSAIVVLMDRSGSIAQDQTGLDQQKKWLVKYLNGHLNPGTDVLVMDINSSSASAVNHKDILWRHENETKTEDEQTDSDRIVAESARSANDRKQIRSMKAQLMQILFSAQTARSFHTQIIELMPVLQQTLARYDKVSILFLSDMLQESDNRNFLTHPIFDKAQAELMAEHDARKLGKRFGLDPNMLNRVSEIRVLIPTGTDQKMLITTPYYFGRFFALFGFKGQIKWNGV